MPSVRRVLLLCVALASCWMLSTEARSHRRDIRNRKRNDGNAADVERQLADLTVKRSQHHHQVADEKSAVHDDVRETRYRPVYDSDGDGDVVRRHDGRADSGLTADQKTQLVDEHNRQRREEGATNIEKLKWNRKLERLAKMWTAKCSFRHGSPLFNADDLMFNGVGQNNWLGDDSDATAIDVKTVVDQWSNERQYFDYDSLQCSSGQSCDRYKQVVWSSTTDIGCAVELCDSVGGRSNAYFLVCYYGPPGNWLEEKPYAKGPEPCSQCRRGQFYCTDGLCDSTCKKQSTACECKAACKNCATTTSDCRCECKDGSTGVDCSHGCVDLDERCGRKAAGWPRVMCRPNFQFVIDACPKMCRTCTEGSPCGRHHYGNDARSI